MINRIKESIKLWYYNRKLPSGWTIRPLGDGYYNASSMYDLNVAGDNISSIVKKVIELDKDIKDYDNIY